MGRNQSASASSAKVGMISIVIPCYSMGNRGPEFLSELLDSIKQQTFTNWELIISDDGRTCADVVFASGIKQCLYIPGVEGAAANLNHAIDFARGEIIKPMFQDDKFIEADSLQKIANAFNSGSAWVCCESQNGGDEGLRNDLFKPYVHNSLERLREGENTYGSPSAMAWEKSDLRFDENLHWLFDCEFYARMARRLNQPWFLDTRIFIRQWSGMATNAVATGGQRVADYNYVVEKYRDHGGQPFA